MKGILLAGGLGTRLYPLTLISNKHLLPVFDRPMIYYGIEAMRDSGIKDIMVVTGGEHAQDFVRVLGNGEEFGVDLWYRYQDKPGGIAQALGLARNWVCDEPVVVMLADNILEQPFGDQVKEFAANPLGARIFVTKVHNPEAYGVVNFNHRFEIESIEEKPSIPKSKYIAIGLYFYDTQVWDMIDQLKPSQRGELEITDVNNHYLSLSQLRAHRLPGWWADAGESFESYHRANHQARYRKKP